MEGADVQEGLQRVELDATGRECAIDTNNGRRVSQPDKRDAAQKVSAAA